MGKKGPSLETIGMVEKTLLDSEDYPTRMELYRRLPKKTHYSTYKRILEYLEASNKIMFNTDKIVYVAGTEKLRKYFSTFVELK